MKKLIMTLAIGVLNSCLCFGQGINFEKELSWAQIKEKARKENKYIFLDLYTTWCTPCKVMDQEVFPKTEVGEFFNDKFISVKVQGDRTSKDSEYVKSWYQDAQMLHGQFSQVVPTYIIISPEGQPFYKFSGSKSIDEFLKLIKIGLTPSSNHFTALLAKVKSGNFDAAEVRALSGKARDLGLHSDVSKQLQPMISKLSPSKLTKSENAWLVWEFTGSIEDRGFELMLKHGANFEKAHPLLAPGYLKAKLKDLIQDAVIAPAMTQMTVTNGKGEQFQSLVMLRDSLPVLKQKLKRYGSLGAELYRRQETVVGAGEMAKLNVFDKEIKPFLETRPNWQQVKQRIAAQNAGDGEEWLVGNTVVYYLIKSMTDKEYYLPLAVTAQQYYNEKFPYMLDGGALNERAWAMFTGTENIEVLIAAQGWAKKAFELNPFSNQILDTYANLTYKIGQKEKAVELYKQVLEMTPEDEYAQKVLKLMEAGKPIYEGDQFLGW